MRQNKTNSQFSRESSSLKPRTMQKQTAAAGWVLPEGCVHETNLLVWGEHKVENQTVNKINKC